MQNYNLGSHNLPDYQNHKYKKHMKEKPSIHKGFFHSLTLDLTHCPKKFCFPGYSLKKKKRMFFYSLFLILDMYKQGLELICFGSYLLSNDFFSLAPNRLPKNISQSFKKRLCSFLPKGNPTEHVPPL